ncbi:CcdB family protein [Sphingomonas sp. GCM10030256]|uniref:CcdB family protein n=1 Tax=Sphingomonas sp. GCM10030256 TaxID=3273427 RepID=UPI003608AC76
MAQFDVHSLADGGLVVDCQAEVLRFLQTRFIVPLLPAGLVLETPGLNPTFVLNGSGMSLYPQGAANIPTAELGALIGSLADEQHKVMNAIDMLLAGF